MILPPWLRSIRARMTAWTAVVIAAVLVAYAGGVFLFLRASLYEELDGQLREDFRSAEGSLVPLRDGRFIRGGGGASGDVDGAPANRWIEVWGSDGTLLYREGIGDPELPPPEGLDRALGFASIRTVGGASAGPLRTYSAIAVFPGARALIRVARLEDGVRQELTELLVGIAVALPTAVLLACLGGYFLAGRAMRPVGRMAERAREITADHLGTRLPIEDPDDELGRLGTVFNETLARLERSFASLRRFTADAAHELRTPLTALRSVGEVALRDAPSPVDHREVVASMLEEVDRLAGLVDRLLMLSRADSAQVPVLARRVALREIAEEVREYLEPLAAEKGQRILVEGEASVNVRADPLLVRQAVLNVLDNAIEHSPPGADLRLVVGRDGSAGLLDVVDQGPGIAAQHRERIFERFYRVDPARSRETGGAGLGLAIAQWAVHANGGSIAVRSEAGTGSMFRIRLRLEQAPGGRPPTAGSR